MSMSDEVGAYLEDLVALRRDFHQHPELGGQEHRTSRLVAEYLTGLGLEVGTGVASTGVVGLLRGAGSGRTVLLRADMDALPIHEETNLSFRSLHDGVMHACGHDGHVAMLLTTARILSKRQNEIAGNVKFVFQPNEEGSSGARDMIDAGVLEDPSVDAALAVHLWAALPCGQLGLISGAMMAGAILFRLRIVGEAGHTAMPFSAVDPILTACSIVQSVQEIQSREIDALKPTGIAFGCIHGGSVSNAIPAHVDLEGTIRYLYAEEEEEPAKRFARIVGAVCSAYRAEFELTFHDHTLAVVNDVAITETARLVAAQVVGSAQVRPLVSMVGEDFSEFSSRVPGAMCLVGAGPEPGRTFFPHHHPEFDIDERALPLGVEYLVATTLALSDQ